MWVLRILRLSSMKLSEMWIAEDFLLKNCLNIEFWVYFFLIAYNIRKNIWNFNSIRKALFVVLYSENVFNIKKKTLFYKSTEEINLFFSRHKSNTHTTQNYNNIYTTTKGFEAVSVAEHSSRSGVQVEGSFWFTRRLRTFNCFQTFLRQFRCVYVIRK